MDRNPKLSGNTPLSTGIPKTIDFVYFARKEWKHEDDKRNCVWEEDGYNGIKRVRVANPEGRVPWHKFANRTLSAYRAKRFRDLFRVPHVIFGRFMMLQSETIGRKGICKAHA